MSTVETPRTRARDLAARINGALGYTAVTVDVRDGACALELSESGAEAIAVLVQELPGLRVGHVHP